MRSTSLTFIVFLLYFCAMASSAMAEGRVLLTLREHNAAATSNRKIYNVRLSKGILNARQFVVNTPTGPIIGQRNGFSRAATLAADSKVGTSSSTGKTVFSTTEHTSEYVLSVSKRTRNRSVIHGIFNGVDDQAFILRRAKGRTVLEIVNKADLPTCGGTRPHGHASNDEASLGTTGDVRVRDGGFIDVAVIYSTEAAAEAGGAAALDAEAASAIALSNQGYAQSGVTGTLRLVYVGQTGTETGLSFETILDRLIDPSDGFFDSAHQIRQQVEADLVVYMVKNQAYCGLAPLLLSTTDTSFAPIAFTAVNRGCISNHSFVHELSHMLGANHDVANAGDESIYPYSYGYRFSGLTGAWRTIMAYAPNTRINYLSNPNLQFDGRALGTSLANNARTVRNTWDFVSTFSDLVKPTPTPSPTPTRTATPTPIPGVPTPTATATSTPGASGGPVPPPSEFSFARIKAKVKKGKCKVTASIAGPTTPEVFGQLLVSKTSEIVQANFVVDAQVKFSIKKTKVKGKKLQIRLSNQLVSEKFSCR